VLRPAAAAAAEAVCRQLFLLLSPGNEAAQGREGRQDQDPPLERTASTTPEHQTQQQRQQQQQQRVGGQDKR